jgi:outer membrane protein TolC
MTWNVKSRNRHVVGVMLALFSFGGLISILDRRVTAAPPTTTLPELAPRPAEGSVPSPFAEARAVLSLRSSAAVEPEALPSTLPSAPSTQPPISSPTGGGPPGSAFTLTLFPGQVIQPIDLSSTLRLAGARSPDIAIARQRVMQAVADLEQARALWLPSLFLGPTFYRADGQIQTITGQVQTIDRQSLFLGGTAALANAYPAPSPGTGFPALTGLSAVLRISDAIFEPMAAQRVAAAQSAGLRATANDTLLGVAESYFDLQLAAGSLAIAREAAGNAEALSSITAAFTATGEGLEADHRRALAEFHRRRRDIQAAAGQLKVASTQVIRLLVLDPRLVVAPVEPAESIVRLVPDDAPLDSLVAIALLHRPELAQAQETVKATLVRLKQAKLRPLVPAVSGTYAGGGFGGGKDAFFGNFGPRGDFAASLFWDLRNLGFTDLAICHRRRAENRAADADLIRVQAQVAADVVAAYEARAAASAQMTEAGSTVTESIKSLELNFLNIRRGSHLRDATRPIEVLQPIQALALGRADYLESVLAYNRAQFRLYRALGNTPGLEAAPCSPALPPAGRVSASLPSG